MKNSASLELIIVCGDMKVDGEMVMPGLVSKMMGTLLGEDDGVEAEGLTRRSSSAGTPVVVENKISPSSGEFI